MTSTPTKADTKYRSQKTVSLKLRQCFNSYAKDSANQDHDGPKKSPSTDLSREKISTSPSGRHLGLYGALVTAYCNAGGEFSTYHKSQDQTTQEISEQILMMIHGLAASAARLGFFLHRWIQVMVTKPSVPTPERSATDPSEPAPQWHSS
jgi:hypothetical protein